MSDPQKSYKYTVSPQAYILPLLHAARHLTTVLGIFLGQVSSSEILIAEAIPLIHNYTSLSIMTEIALEMAEVYAEDKGMKVIGMYLAQESGTGLGRVGERVLGAIRERFVGAFAMVVGSPSGSVDRKAEEGIGGRREARHDRYPIHR